MANVRPPDPLTIPGRQGSSPAACLAHSVPLSGTRGQTYVERRGIPLDVADAAGLRYERDFKGRPAVLVGLYNSSGDLKSVHGRYLDVTRVQDKMLTIGPGSGLISVLGGWHSEPLIVVEGLFDALSLAVCGWACVATIGRWVPWLREVSAGRTAWLAFDMGRPGDAEFERYAGHLSGDVRRLRPPGLSKDWNTALMNRGKGAVADWLTRSLK